MHERFVRFISFSTLRITITFASVAATWGQESSLEQKEQQRFGDSQPDSRESGNSRLFRTYQRAFSENSDAFLFIQVNRSR
jgi:hypothetical protein